MPRPKKHPNGMRTIAHRCPTELHLSWKTIKASIAQAELRKAIEKIIKDNGTSNPNRIS